MSLAAVALGLAAGATWTGWGPALGVPAAAVVALALGAFAFRRRTLALGLALVLPMALYTAWRAPGPAADDVAHLAPRRFLRVEGVVLDPPTRRNGAWRADLHVDTPAPGRLAIRFPDTMNDRPIPGQRYAVTGRLLRPEPAANPGGHDAQAYLARRDVFASLGAEVARPLGPDPVWSSAARRALDALRMRLLVGLGRDLPPDQAALAGSLILGTGAAPVPDALARRFRDAGLAHLLAASGAQVGLLGLLAYKGLRACGCAPLPAAAGALPVLLGYLFLTGAPTGMIRATVMGAVGLLALARGQSGVPFAALWATVAAMVLVDPGSACDLGFQFSVLATYSLLRLAQAPWGAGRVRAFVLSPVAAWLWVSPWQVATFNTFPLAALPANWVAAPLVMGLTPYGVLVATVGLISPAVSGKLNLVTGWLLTWLIGVAETATAYPGQLLTVASPAPWVLLAVYGALACGLQKPRAAIALLAVFLLSAPTSLTSPTLTITFLAVGQGDAAVIRTPHGRFVLIDAGPAGRHGDAGESIVLPYLRRLGCRKLDLVVASHPHADHVGGIPAVTRAMPVAVAWDAAAPAEDAAGGLMLAALLTAGVPWRTPPCTLSWSADGVTLTAIPRPGEPASVNDASLVLRLDYGATRILLPGDLEAPGEAALLRNPDALRADVLKVGHHGSRGASTAEWLAAVKPSLAVVSAGLRNVHGHPHAEALERLTASGAAIARTDEAGAVIVRSDGRRCTYTDRRRGWRFD